MKNMLKIILILNTFIWIIISTVNYIGIMQQLNEDIMSIFLWSVFTIMMYGMIIYSISLVISRLFLLYQYKSNKDKYINTQVLRRQIVLLIGAMLYLYGACYYNSNFLGLLPMFLFFSKLLTDAGRFYIYEKDSLLMIEDMAKEYLVKVINQVDGKIEVIEINTRNTDRKELTYKLHSKESKFLSDFFMKEVEEKEVA
jgi:hypothetical protein